MKQLQANQVKPYKSCHIALLLLNWEMFSYLITMIVEVHFVVLLEARGERGAQEK